MSLLSCLSCRLNLKQRLQRFRPLDGKVCSGAIDISTRQAKHVPWQAQAGPPKSTSFTYDNIVTVIIIIIIIIIATIIIALHKPP